MGAAAEQFGNFAYGAADTALNTVLGLALSRHNDKRQLKQQGKLQKQQIAGSKELTDYNFQKQMEMWQNTNYGAQMEQLKKAGLNPGLLYGMSGGGGTTTGSAGAPIPTGAQATQTGGMEIKTAMEMGMMQAQKRLMESQASNLDADTENKSGVQRENIATQTLDLLQGIQNKKAQQKLQEIQTDILEIDKEIKGKTKDQAIQIIDNEAQRGFAEVERLFRQNTIDKATMNDKIDLVKQELANLIARTHLTNAQTTTEQGKPAIQQAEMTKIAQEVISMMRAGEQKWRELELMGANVDTARQRLENELMEQFNNIPKELTRDIINVLILKQIAGQKTHTPIKGFAK